MDISEDRKIILNEIGEISTELREILLEEIKDNTVSLSKLNKSFMLGRLSQLIDLLDKVK
ncbi:hypothetical protein [Clostridium cadaveris]|uniref:hypothetical protein n=1 Tax=Clostridium cadaveris TaxID=1529 RepID=UPI000C07F092|nr:hypothetical protein [Clostridium cadaveris]